MNRWKQFLLTAALAAAVMTPSPADAASDTPGYWIMNSNGYLSTYGVDRPYVAPNIETFDHLNRPLVGAAANPNSEGIWIVASDGGVFTGGNTKFFGSLGGTRLNKPIVNIASTLSGNGYFLLAADGGIFTFGDAKFHGSAIANVYSKAVSIEVTQSGEGYWVFFADGSVYPFGDASQYGPANNLGRLNAPITTAVSTPARDGYWEVAADGGVFSFGAAGFHGSMAGQRLNAPIVGIVPTNSGQGYYLVGADGGVFTFGDAKFDGAVINAPKSMKSLAILR